MTGHTCVILAKGNSRRLPHKNKLLFDGLTLPRRAVECAKSAGIFDRIVLDTDDHEIHCGFSDVEVNWRDESVRGDNVDSAKVILAIPNIADSQTVTLLQPTSPLRDAEDVTKCMIALTSDPSADSIVSVVKIKNSNRIFRMDNYIYISPITYAVQECCVTNGAIWCIKTPVFMLRRTFITERTIFYEMPKERSVDIDTKDDFLHALALWEKGYGKNRDNC